MKKIILNTILIILLIITTLPIATAENHETQLNTIAQAQAQADRTILREHVKTRAEIKKYFENEKELARNEIIKIIDTKIDVYKRDLQWLIVKNLFKLSLILLASQILAYVTWDVIRRKIYKKHLKTENLLESPMMQKLTSIETKMKGYDNIIKKDLAQAENIIEGKETPSPPKQKKKQDNLNQLYDEIMKSKNQNLNPLEEIKEIQETKKQTLLEKKQELEKQYEQAIQKLNSET